MADNPTLDAIFSNPALITGSGALSGAATSGVAADTAQTPLTSPGGDASTGGVYSPTAPNYLSTYNSGIGTMERIMKSLYTPDQTYDKIKDTTTPTVVPPAQVQTPGQTPETPQTTTPQTTTPQTEPTSTPGSSTDDESLSLHSGYDRVVGNADTFGLNYGRTVQPIDTPSGGSGGWLSGRGTEFGEVDNPAYGGYTEANWDKGAWGDTLSGWDTEGVALPNVPHGTVVELMNPQTGATTTTTVKDKGPGAATGAAIDMLGGTRAALGLSKNFSGTIQYRVVNGSTPSKPVASTDTGLETGIGAFGHNILDPNQEGAALPHSVVKNSIGDYTTDPSVYNAIKNGDYRVAVTNQDGATKIVPIVDVTGDDLSGNSLSLTYRTSHDLGTEGNAKVGYQILGPGGESITANGYHPNSIKEGNWDDHIGLGDTDRRQGKKIESAVLTAKEQPAKETKQSSSQKVTVAPGESAKVDNTIVGGKVTSTVQKQKPVSSGEAVDWMEKHTDSDAYKQWMATGIIPSSIPSE